MENKKIECKRCNHTWVPRTKSPVECPNCKSRKWGEGKNGREE